MVEAWGPASRWPGYQCRGSLGSLPLFPAGSPLLSQRPVPLVPQVYPSLLPSRPRLQAFLPPQRGRPARQGGPSRARSASTLLPALDLPPPPAQQFRAGCEGGCCSGAVPPRARGLIPIGSSTCQSSHMGGGAWANRKWAGGHWLTGRSPPSQVWWQLRPQARARLGPRGTGRPGLGHVRGWPLSCPCPHPTPSPTGG